MQIKLEQPDNHSILSYSDRQVTISNQTYGNSIIVCKQSVDNTWQKDPSHLLNENDVDKILQYNPEIVIIGHQRPEQLLHNTTQRLFLHKKVGLELMNIGAACRTFNVLLNEQRNVVLALIIPGA